MSLDEFPKFFGVLNGNMRLVNTPIRPGDHRTVADQQAESGQGLLGSRGVGQAVHQPLELLLNPKILPRTMKVAVGKDETM